MNDGEFDDEDAAEAECELIWNNHASSGSGIVHIAAVAC
jgi:hypothetical protein